MLSAKQKSNNGVEKSDDESIVYGKNDSSDESVNLCSDEFSSDSDVMDSDYEVWAIVHVWCKVHPQQPSATPPRFSFTGRLQVPVVEDLFYSKITTQG